VPFDTWHDVADAARQVQEIRPGLAAYFGTGSDRIFHWPTNFGVPFEGNIPDLTPSRG
jgi:hypothetical protein